MSEVAGADSPMPLTGKIGRNQITETVAETDKGRMCPHTQAVFATQHQPIGCLPPISTAPTHGVAMCLAT